MLTLFVRFVAWFGVEVGNSYVAMACLIARVYQSHGVDAITDAGVLQTVELEPAIPMQRLANLLPLVAKVVDIRLLPRWA